MKVLHLGSNCELKICYFKVIWRVFAKNRKNVSFIGDDALEKCCEQIQSLCIIINLR